ncbi:MAG TPA: DUF308 domain-containing protein [Gryllotalpicola sp.]
MITTDSGALAPMTAFLRRLYFIRFAFAIVWAVVLIASGGTAGPLLTVLLVIYPLVDAASVLWQIRSEGAASQPRVTEWINVVVSVIVAIALGVTSTVSVAAALGVWGAWAVVSGITQLITAVLRRRAGGQWPQILSGAISVLAGGSFLLSAIHGATSMSTVGGYAILGGVFFVISAIRLSILLRRAARA